jgi:5-methylcytosine-specific restriction endonuclease McrA
MVAKIPKPDDDSIKILNHTLGERVKFKKFYTRITQDLTARYNLYDVQKGCPNGMPPLVLRNYVQTDIEAVARKKSLIGLYDPTTDKYPFNELKKLRKKNKLLACPLCGEVGRPRTLDHCLPKTTYPEFSIHLLNLVPACDWCQGEKLMDYKNAAGERSFLHPYYDEVNRPLYTIRLQAPYLTPVISFEIRDDLPEDLKKLVASHLEGIDFWVRFKEYFENSYQNIILIASDTRAAGAVTVAKVIEIGYSLQVTKGFNSWDAVVYRSLLEDPNVMDFLENGVLSAFP